MRKLFDKPKNKVACASTVQEDLSHALHLHRRTDTEEARLVTEPVAAELKPSFVFDFNQFQKQTDDRRSRLFREIKSYFVNKRKISKEELYRQSMKIQIRESHLQSISPKFGVLWHKIQKKTTFLSIMRNSLQSSRLLGIFPRRLRSFVFDYDEDKSELKWFVIYPDSLLNEVTAFFMLLIVVYIFITFPLEICFPELFSDGDFAPVARAVNIFILVFFLLDLIFGFFTAIEKNQQVVDDLKSIAYRYLTTWFFLDLVATFPFDMIFTETPLSFRAALKLPRLFRVYNAILYSKHKNKKSRSLIKSRLKLVIKSSEMLFLLKTLLFSFSFIHLAACLWIGLTNLNQEDAASR